MADPADTNIAPTPTTPTANGAGDGGTAFSLTEIPKNTRNGLLPFFIPSRASNSDIQTFSFRKKDNPDEDATINIIPSDRDEFNNDLGAKLLIAKTSKDPNGKTAQSPDLQTLLNEIPAIQIREYTQDTKLDVLWGVVNSFIKGFKTGSGELEADTFKQTEKLTRPQLAYFGGRLSKTLKTNKWWYEFLKEAGSWVKTQFLATAGFKLTNDQEQLLVIEAVYCLYYRMLGATTTNRYILPYNGTEIYNTDGKSGWPTAGTHDVTSSKNSILTKMLSFGLGNNLKIVTQPIWGGNGGTTTQITVQLDLFNDTYEHAMHNFLFVNTICPSNLFLQYGIWQLPPSVYDIKIEGGRRWFMCKGSMTCTAKGVMRNPPREFVKDLFKKYRNTKLFPKEQGMTETFINNGIIKIPDVYSLNMQFESCLPDNFNHIMFQYCANDNILTRKNSREEGWWSSGSQVQDYITNTLEDAAKAASSIQASLSVDTEAAKAGYNAPAIIPTTKSAK